MRLYVLRLAAKHCRRHSRGNALQIRNTSKGKRYLDKRQIRAPSPYLITAIYVRTAKA